MSSGGTETGAGVEAVVIVEIDGWAEAPVSSLALLLVDVLELVLALPGDGADSGRSTSDEISTMKVVAGFVASSRRNEKLSQWTPSR